MKIYVLFIFLIHLYHVRYLKDYFTPGWEMLKRDANMLTALLKKSSPAVHRHLIKHKIDPLLCESILLTKNLIIK